MKEEGLASEFVKRLNELEAKEGLRTRDLAEILSISIQRARLFETGYALPNYGELRALSDYFHLSADYFLCLDGRDCLFLSSLTCDEARDFLYFLIPTLEEFFQSRHPLPPSPP